MIEMYHWKCGSMFTHNNLEIIATYKRKYKGEGSSNNIWADLIKILHKLNVNEAMMNLEASPTSAFASDDEDYYMWSIQIELSVLVHGYEYSTFNSSDVRDILHDEFQDLVDVKLGVISNKLKLEYIDDDEEHDSTIVVSKSTVHCINNSSTQHMYSKSKSLIV